MRPICRLAVCLAVLGATLVGRAHAQDKAVYVVTYVEVMPSAVAGGTQLLEHYRDSSRAQEGNLRVDTLQEIARPNRFAIVEVWNDGAAFEAHAKAQNVSQFRENVKSLENAPDDERVASLLDGAAIKSTIAPGAIFVVTHVDVIPSGKDNCIAAFKAMSVDTAGDPGNLGYQVLQQANRGNHFSVLEIWSGKTTLDAHAIAAHTRSFRGKVAPLAGALYDERLYKALD